METLNTLQFLRFSASLLVLLFHLNLFRSGYKGVDLFFVISGFVMYYTLFHKERPKAINFIINRVSKIFFLYWIALILLFFLSPFELNSSVLSSIFLVPGHYPLLGVSWSLSYELYFYFLIGTITYLLPKKYQKIIFYILILISTTIIFLNLTDFTLKNTNINFLFGGNLWEFLIGLAASYFSLKYFNFFHAKTALLLALFCFLLFLIFSIEYANPITYLIYGPISFFLIVFFIIYEKNKELNLNVSRCFKILGDSSYSIYLFGPIVTLIMPNDSNFSKIVIILITICFSILFNQFIEKNFLNWIKKVTLFKNKAT